jgi:ABC-type dipeptide/oligopeptide/nickel transport system permease component
MRALLSVLRAILVAVLATFAVFCALRFALPDANTALLSRHADAAARASLHTQLHNDQPLLPAFAAQLADFARGEWGSSFRSGVAIRTQLAEKLSISLSLLLPGIVLAHIVSVLTASRGLRSGILGLSVALISASGMLLLALSVQYGGARIGISSTGVLASVSLLLVLVAQLLPMYAPVLRGTQADLIRRASSALGYSRLRAELSVLRVNALPLLTIALSSIAVQLFAGAVVLESVFNVPGMGLWLRDAALSVDAPVLLAVTAVATLAVSLTASVLRLTQAWLDPRVAS